MIGSVPLSNGSGSSRPKNIRTRIRDTDWKCVLLIELTLILIAEAQECLSVEPGAKNLRLDRSSHHPPFFYLCHTLTNISIWNPVIQVQALIQESW